MFPSVAQKEDLKMSGYGLMDEVAASRRGSNP